MVPRNFSWTLTKVALMIKTLPFLTLDQKHCFVREVASLWALGSRLGMPRLALKASEAYAQLERYLFVDAQSTSMLIRGDLRVIPQGCALSVHFCNQAGWAWNVCMKRELPHVRTNAYVDDRLVSADSCDPLPRKIILVQCSTAKRPLGPRQNSRRVVARNIVNSLITPGHLCILVLMCLCVVPRVRMKQRVRAVGVRSELIRVLPPSQRGILVSDTVASLWIAGGTSFGISTAQTHVIEVGWSIERFGGHAMWQTCACSGTSFWSRCAQNVPACRIHLHFLFAIYTHGFHGKIGCSRFANLWAHRAQCLGCVHGIVEACRAIAVDWCASCELSAGGATFNFSSVESHYSVP